jgi:Zn-dependent peptidase ImmA (M78 family)
MIERAARVMLHQLWLDEGKPPADRFYPIKIDRVVREQCGLRIEEIENQTAEASKARRIIGLIDRDAKVIGVSAAIPMAQRRFTIAHEVGHFKLHPKINQHREQLFGGQRRPQQELEADLFASEFLLPRKAVVERFRATLGVDIDRARLDELNLANLAHTGFKPQKRGSSVELRSFSIALASTQRWGWAHFRSMSDYFGSSNVAVAIRMEELELVR